MSDAIFSSELFRICTAVLTAAVASAAARGAANSPERSLGTFRKFYLDLSAAFLCLACLRTAGLGSWTSFSLSGLGKSAAASANDFVLPGALVLLFISFTLARHQWKRLRHGVAMDMAATVVALSVILMFASRATSAHSAKSRFDMMSKTFFSLYCGADRQGPHAEGDGAAASLLLDLSDREQDSSRSMNEGAITARGRRPGRRRGGYRRTGSRPPASFCDALEAYVHLRSMDG